MVGLVPLVYQVGNLFYFSMLGSTLFQVDDIESLKKMSIDEIIENNQYQKVEFDTLVTLDFETWVGDVDKKWSGGDPVYFSEKEGVAVIPLDSEGIRYVIEQSHLEEDEIRKGDLKKLSEFVQQFGSDNLFEIAVF